MPTLVRRARSIGPTPTRRRRGQAIVEMAIVAMVLVVLVAGIVDFGIFFYRYVQAANCVREVARRAAVRDPDAATPGEDNFCMDAAANGDLTVTADWVNLDAGEDVTASMSTTHSWLAISYLIPVMDDTIQINASSTMRMEGNRT